MDFRIIVAMATVAVLSCNSLGAKAQPTTITVATWNIERLREENGVGFRKRTIADFAQLAKIADQLDADIIALQEVENAAAARRVFGEGYQYFISERPSGPGGLIRTGFAIRSGIFVANNGDYTAFDVNGRQDLRYGVDVSLDVDGMEIRLLSVHLKARCASGPDRSVSRHCDTRLRQTEPLEAWIDARAFEGKTFIVLGDFNRRYGIENEIEWSEIDDGVPDGSDLIRVTEAIRPTCRRGHFPGFIDHIVLGERAAELIVAGSFKEITFDNVVASDGKPPSDHCPISVELKVQ